MDRAREAPPASSVELSELHDVNQSRNRMPISSGAPIIDTLPATADDMEVVYSSKDKVFRRDELLRAIERERNHKLAWWRFFGLLFFLAVYIVAIRLEQSLMFDYEMESVLRKSISLVEYGSDSKQYQDVNSMAEAWQWIRAFFKLLYSGRIIFTDGMSNLATLNKPFIGAVSDVPFPPLCYSDFDESVDMFKILMNDLNIFAPATCGVQYYQLLNATRISEYYKQTLSSLYNIDIDPDAMQACLSQSGPTFMWIPYGVDNQTASGVGLPPIGENTTLTAYNTEDWEPITENMTNYLLDKMEDFNWVDSRTTAVSVLLYFRNEQIRRFGTVVVSWNLQSSGAIRTTVDVTSAALEVVQGGLYEGKGSEVRAFFEILCIFCFAILAMAQIWEIYVAFRTAPKENQRMCGSYWKRGGYFKLFEFLSLFVFLLTMSSWLYLISLTDSASEKFADDWENKIVEQFTVENCIKHRVRESFFGQYYYQEPDPANPSQNRTMVHVIPHFCEAYSVPVESCCTIIRNRRISAIQLALSSFLVLEYQNILNSFRSPYMVFAGLFMTMLAVRMFRAIPSLSRLALLPLILKKASHDILHFGSVFALTLMLFAVIGHLLYGHELASFSSYGRSLQTCGQMTLGNVDVDSLNAVWNAGYEWVSQIYFWTFILIVFFTLTNVFIALIESAFVVVKEGLDKRNSKPVFAQFKKGALSKLTSILTLFRDATRRSSSTDMSLWRMERVLINLERETFRAEDVASAPGFVARANKLIRKYGDEITAETNFENENSHEHNE